MDPHPSNRTLAGSHRRYNPLLDEWVLTSPHRLSRPWQGQVEPTAVAGLPAYDPSCYLCPGNVRAGGARTPAYASTYAFDNDFPALVAGEPDGDFSDGLLRAQSQAGHCRVVCFSPRHDLTLARMSTPDIARVVDTWANESTALGAEKGIAYVQVFENKGAAMGCSNPHPHCQIWASQHIPHIPARKLAAQQRYFAAHGTDLLGDYLAQETARGERLVCSNESWVALVPFWAVWPFETMVIPRRRVADLPAVAPSERRALSDLLRRLLVRYDNLFRTSFPYSMGWHGGPALEAHPGCRLHAVYFPPLLRSEVIRKFLVGYEMTGEPQRDLSAEDAARVLRDQAERHYLE